ncbi:hypothetical protein K9M48_05010 [Candidatus Gracilibacteria bacterium]|nr:hypothetical protein [Candidatus Gracilibacteria bacterium]
MSDNLRRYIIRVIIINIVAYLIFHLLSNKSGNKEDILNTTGIDIQKTNGDINTLLDNLLKE